MNQPKSTYDDIKTEFSKHKNLPQDLLSYIENVFDQELSNDSLLNAFKEHGIREILSDLDQRFSKACKLYHLRPDELSKALDFNPNDVQKGRIDSFLAELRAIFFLVNNGFHESQPLPAGQHTSPDFLAKYGAYCFAVEVFYSAWDADRYLNHDDEKKLFSTFFCNRVQTKKKQVDSLLNKNRCNRGLFVCVIDTKTITYRCNHESLRCVLTNCSNRLDLGSSYHYALLTGFVSNGVDDVLYPPLPE